MADKEPEGGPVASPQPKARSSNEQELLSVNTESFRDFNYPEINWSVCTTPCSEDHRATTFFQCIKDCFLLQNVSFPTHHRADQSANILDLVFTNDETVIESVGIPNLMKEDGTTTQNDKEKAEELNTFFANGFAKGNLADLPFFEARHNDVILEKIDIYQQDEILANLNPSKSPGPDGIHPRILRIRLSVGIGKKLFGINGCIHDNQPVLQIVITMVDNPQIFPFMEQKFCRSDI
eukprot:gene17108-18831_t